MKSSPHQLMAQSTLFYTANSYCMSASCFATHLNPTSNIFGVVHKLIKKIFETLTIYFIRAFKEERDWSVAMLILYY